MDRIKSVLKRHLDYPLEVAIETTGRCNARCVFCPHDTLERKHQAMSDALFLRIISQLEEIPAHHKFYISPFKVNEFLMDRDIFRRIAWINERLPNAYIRLFSNFNMAREVDIEQICRIKNLSDIDISLNSLDPEEYNRLMGLDLEQTLDRIFCLLAHIRANGIQMQGEKIVLSRVSQDPESDRAYYAAFETVFAAYLDLVSPLVILRQEWIDFMPVQTPLNQDRPCARWADVNICCNGVVAFCCMDGRGAFPWGNVHSSTVLDIYNQPAYRTLRETCPNKNQVTPCRFCSQ